MAEREWKGIWIPKEVWLDERLNALEKIVLFEIDSLDKTESGCFASNEYIAKFCQCSEWKVSGAITKLVNLGYIKITAFDGRRRTIKSCLGFSLIQPWENPKSELGNSQAINNSIISTIDKNNISKSISSVDDDFLKFWTVYPRKEAKKDAMKAWKSINPNEALITTIIADIKKRLAEGGAWYKSERKFVPLPATYLRGARWEDEQAVGTTDEPTNPNEPWWKSRPWWEWPIEEQQKRERELEAELNGG